MRASDDSNSFKPYQTHEIRTVATDDPVAWCFHQSKSVTRLLPARTAERIDVLPGV